MKLSHSVYLDIETLPTADQEMIAAIQADITPPQNYKDPDKIASWLQKEQEQIVGRTALDGTYGRVCAIGAAVDDGPIEVWIGEEAEVLTLFFAHVSMLERVKHEDVAEYECELTWIGHNHQSFDLRFLYQRAVINSIKMPRSLRMASTARPWDKLLADTMVMWNPERDRRISLDKLCRALRIPSPKGEMDGSKVAAAWRDGQKEKICDYVRADVDALRQCYRRMTFQ
jgi:predicted PolB exonuclease-like 3'-5' exonuclease